MFSVCLCARLWYPSEVSLSLVGYSNFNFGSCKLDKKSTSRTCHLLRASLISCHNKKQACVALSTVEVEYIAVGSCCAESLWLKKQLSDFGLKLSIIPLFCDNTNAINLTKNLVQHSIIKHIEIRHHFIKDHVNNGDSEIQFVVSEKQLADLFIKPLDKERFNVLRTELGIIHLSSVI